MEERRHGRASLRIIVVDDDHDTVDMLAVLLRDAGHVVHGVYTGRDVLPMARLLRPDAIILDIQVPGISGYGVAQEIRHTFVQARCPLLIAISGKWMELPDKLIARQVGFDHHLMKPCDPAAVLNLLRPLSP